MQKAMVEVLNAIYEQDFLECSYGFRPGRGQHQALDEVRRVDLHSAHGMDPGVRHHRLLRFDRERATHGDDRETRQRWQRASPDTEVDPGGSHRSKDGFS